MDLRYLQRVISRLRAAGSGSRFLDADIWTAIDPTRLGTIIGVKNWRRGIDGSDEEVPHYTRQLGAAIELWPADVRPSGWHHLISGSTLELSCCIYALQELGQRGGGDVETPLDMSPLRLPEGYVIVGEPRRIIIPEPPDLYVMQNGYGAIKVGRSDAPERRRLQLMAAWRCDLEIVAVLPGAGDGERYFQRQLTRYALNPAKHEWFDGTPPARRRIIEVLGLAEDTRWPFDFDTAGIAMWWASVRSSPSASRPI